MKAILWDNDGVLVDTEPLYFEATRDVLASAGVELTRERFVEVSLTAGQSCFDLARARGMPEDEVAALHAERNRRYQARLEQGVEPLPGVVDALRRLRGRVPMAIVTTCPRGFFETIHSHTGLLDLFEFALTREEYERSKPHPEPYLTAAARLGVAPGEALAIEDTLRGLRSAVAAGVPCAVIPHDLTASQDLSAALRVLASAAEVPALLDELALRSR